MSRAENTDQERPTSQVEAKTTPGGHDPVDFVELDDATYARILANEPTPLELLTVSGDPLERRYIETFLELEERVRVSVVRALRSRGATEAGAALLTALDSTKPLIRAMENLYAHCCSGIQTIDVLHSDGPRVGEGAKTNRLLFVDANTPEGRLFERIELTVVRFKRLSRHFLDKADGLRDNIGDERFARNRQIAVPTDREVRLWDRLSAKAFDKAVAIETALVKIERGHREVKIVHHHNAPRRNAKRARRPQQDGQRNGR